jgi:hypothetical protein
VLDGVHILAGDHVPSTVFVGAMTVLIAPPSCIIPKYFISQNYFSVWCAVNLRPVSFAKGPH